jgi:uridine phosphorylase
VVLSNDGFYPEMESHRMPNESYLRERWEAWKRCGVIGVEMEASALFVAAAIRKIRAGAFCLFVDGAGKNAMPDPKRIPVEDLVAVGVEGLRQLIANDRAKVAEVGVAISPSKIAVS